MALVEDRPPADLMGRVPLHYAALFGDLARAQELIGDGADSTFDNAQPPEELIQSSPSPSCC